MQRMAIPLCLVSAPQDQQFSHELAGYLGHEERQGRLSLLHAAAAPPGSDIAAWRRSSLLQARILVVLVSPDLLGKCTDEINQVAEQLARGAVVLPVVVRETVGLEETPLAALDPVPRGGHPLSLLAGPDRDEAWRQVVRKIKALAEELRRSDLSPRERALVDYTSGRLTDALAAFEAAYAQDADPLLLLSIASVHLDLGDARRALEACHALRDLPAPAPEVSARLAEVTLEALTLQRRGDDGGHPPAPAAPQPGPGEGQSGPSLTIEISKPLREDISALAGSGAEDLWLASKAGIYHYDGAAWTPGYRGRKDRVLHVYQPGDGTLWAVGTNGSVLRFDGASWSEFQKRPTRRDLIGVWGHGPTEVLVMDRTGAIFRLSGIQWLEVEKEWVEGGTLASCFVLSPELVLSVGDEGRVARWDGRRMTRLLSGTARDLRAVWASAADDIWAVGAAGTIVHYDGRRWHHHTDAGGRDLWGIWGAGPASIWAIGKTARRQTRDGVTGGDGTILHYDGQEWSAEVEETWGNLLGIGGSGPRDVIALGDICAHFDGEGWSRLPRALGGTLHSFVATGPGQGWAFGEDGVILRREGGSWSARYSQPDHPLHDILRLAHDDIWAVGSAGIILHFDGSRWSPVDSGTIASLRAAWASGPADAWAVGGKGVILRWDGSRWWRMKSPTDRDLLSVSGSGPSDIWVVGGHGLVFHWDGEIWTDRAFAPGWVSDDVLQVHADGPGTAWIQVNYKRIFRHTDGAWSPVPEESLPPMGGTYDKVTRISGTGPQDVWLVQWRGRVSHFDGQRWTVVHEELAETDPHNAPVVCTPSGEVWVACKEQIFRLRNPQEISATGEPDG